MKRLFALAATFAFVLGACAHIGSPNVFFEGNAGPYPIRVVIRPPGVIPGLAEISVRAQTNNVDRVLVLPIHWNAGKKGAPRPDEAKLIGGESNLYSAQLWFMRGGAESVEVEVVGTAGRGRVMVPVNSVATRVQRMPPALGTMLALLAVGLVCLATSIFGGAIRESVLPAGEAPTRRRSWLARAMMAGTLVMLMAFVWFGRRWWESEARDYRNNRLFRPVTTDAFVADGKLRVNFGAELLRRNGPLVPDHGKLMHLFLVREPAMDAFAHLHPAKVDWSTFETALPELPAGDYTLYGDVTYETGFADTLTTRVTIPNPGNAKAPLDRDDAWIAAPNNSATIARLGSTNFVENHDADLRFTIRDKQGNPAALEPYMGMAAHLIVRRDDGAVFTHLHPSGTYSMAAKQLFELRAEDERFLKIARFTNEPLCKLPLVVQTGEFNGSEISFPYAFPKPGKYRLWVQARVAGEIVTSAFDVDVAPARRG